jgi:hypothetical protein
MTTSKQQIPRGFYVRVETEERIQPHADYDDLLSPETRARLEQFRAKQATDQGTGTTGE